MGLPDLWVSSQAGGDFTRLNTISTQFDLVINPADEFVIPVLVQSDKISRPIVRLAVLERAVYEFFCRQFLSIPISDRDPNTTDVQLARLAWFHRLAVIVTDAKADASDRFSNRGSNTGLQDCVTCSDSCFGWPIRVDQSDLRADVRKPGLDLSRIGFLTAKHDRLHRSGQVQ